MLFTTTVLALASLTSALVAQNPTYHHQHTNGTLSAYPYAMVDPTWIAHESMGRNITFTGPHHVITSQIAALKPNWHTNATHLAVLQARAIAAVAEADFDAGANATHPLEARSNRISQFCGSSAYAWGGRKASLANAAYITKHYGTGLCMQKAHSCSRWACNYNTALVTCNDEGTDSVFECTTLQQNANFLNDFCVSTGGDQVNGQAFYINPKYNVLVKGVDYGKWC